MSEDKMTPGDVAAAMRAQNILGLRVRLEALLGDIDGAGCMLITQTIDGKQVASVAAKPVRSDG